MHFEYCIESLYRACTAGYILIQGSIHRGQFSLLTTSSPGVWRFPRLLLGSIRYTDFGEFTFHALG